MNWCSLLLSAFLGIVYKFVSVSASATNKTDPNDIILMAVVSNLPKSCKSYTEMGKFNSGSENSYECLFDDDDSFDIKKASLIMSLLMQGGCEKLVQGIAKKWVNERKWGPFNQSKIASELMAILSVKTAVRFGKNTKMKMKIESKSIYETFKTLLRAGKDLIVANEVYSYVAAEAFNLALKVDESESDYVATTSIILDHFYSINEKISSADEKGFDNAKLARAGFAVSSLNNLTRKMKIDAEAWEVYGPVICKQLNSIYGTDFVMVDEAVVNETKTKKKRKGNYTDEESESLEENNGDEFASATPKTIKVIDLKSEFRSKVVVTAPASPASPASSKSAFEFEFGNGFWLVTGGSSILILSLAFAVYHFFIKRRGENTKLSDL